MPVSARLRESRARATLACQASERLCARATTEATRSRELQSLLSAQARSWRGWHRLWRRVVLHPSRAAVCDAGAARPRLPAVLRVCMFCERVYVALPLARGLAEADEAWRAVPPWVRGRIADPKFRVVFSHGACPACARRHMDFS